MKKTILLKTMLLLCALIAGSSSSWADEYVKVTADDQLVSGDVYIIATSSAVATAYSSNSLTTTGTGFTESDGTITTTTATPMEFTLGLVAGNYTLKMSDGKFLGYNTKTNFRNSATDGTDTKEQWWITNNATYNLFTIVSVSSDGGRYIGTGNDVFKPYAISNLETYAPATLYKKKVAAVATPTFSPGAGTYTSPQTVTISCATEGASIYYTVTGETPTSSSTLYTGPIEVSYMTLIKAIAIKGSDASSVAQALYEFITIEHAGTKYDPYTVADARAAIDAGVGVTGVYATGIVSGIVTAYNATYENISFNISTDGLTTSPQLQAYRCIKGDADSDPDVADINVGDVVVVKGDLVKYGETYEFKQDNVLISLTHPAVPTVTVTPTSLTGFTYEEGNGPSAAQTISVSGSNLKSGFSLALGADTGYELSFEENGVYNNYVMFDPTDGAVAATTVYVRMKAGLAAGTYNENIYVNSTDFDIKTIALEGSVTVPEAPNVTWDLSKKTYDEITDEDLVTWSSTYATMTNSSESGGTKATNYLGGDTNSRTSSRFYASNTLTITPASGYAITSVVFTATSSGYANALANSTWTNATATVNDKIVTVTPDDVTNAFSAVISGTCGFTEVKVYYEAIPRSVNATIGAAGYATFSSNYAVDFSATSIEVYTAAVSGDKVILTEVASKKVPAKTGVVLKGETANANVIASADALTGNELVVSDGTVKGGDGIYVLANKSAGVGFYKVASTVTIPAGKCYLSTIVTTAPDFLGFDGETTGINAVNGSEFMVNGSDIYNLNGQRVAQPTKGLYIVNGKKVILK